MSHGLPRFSIIPADAVTDPRLEGRDLQILALFGRHTDRRGWCCRSQVKMARELNCGRATIQRSIARLVDAGYLEHRVKYRESGGDTAHEYRVVLDVPDDRYGAEIPHDVDDDDGGEISHRRESRVHNPDTVEGVPTHGQGVPTGGQGVPTQDGQGVPTHGRAPMLTTPVKRSSRECARDRDECQPADFAGRTDEQFERARRAWPSGFADSREDAWQAWGELTEAEQVDAVDEIPRFVAATRSVGRKLFCGFAAYLRERKWQALPPRPKPIERKPAQPPTPRGPSPFERKHAQEFPQLFSGDAPVAGPSPIEKRMRDSEALST